MDFNPACNREFTAVRFDSSNGAGRTYLHRIGNPEQHANEDFALPMKQMEETEAAVKQKAGPGEGEDGYHWQIKYYEGVPHGFAVRAREGYDGQIKAEKEACEQAVAWFKKHLL